MAASLEAWIPECGKMAETTALIQGPDPGPTRHFRIGFFAANEAFIATHLAPVAPHGEI